MSVLISYGRRYYRIGSWARWRTELDDMHSIMNSTALKNSSIPLKFFPSIYYRN